MVWILVVVLVLLGVGWYVWGQGVTSSEYATPVPVQRTISSSVEPHEQAQGTSSPSDADYQPSHEATGTPPAVVGTSSPTVTQ